MARLWLLGLILASALIISYLLFGLRSYTISGDSMDPLLCEGDIVLVDRIFWRLGGPKENSLMTFSNNGKTIVKRTVLLENQSIKIDENYGIYIHGRYLPLNPQVDWAIEGGYLHIPENNYFVLGDNLSQSFDSRHYGLINKKRINGAVLGVLYHESGH